MDAATVINHAPVQARAFVFTCDEAWNEPISGGARRMVHNKGAGDQSGVANQGQIVVKCTRSYWGVAKGNSAIKIR